MKIFFGNYKTIASPCRYYFTAPGNLQSLGDTSSPKDVGYYQYSVLCFINILFMLVSYDYPQTILQLEC